MNISTLKELICVPARLKKSVILPRNPVYSNHPRYLKFQNFPSGIIISYLCNLGRLYATKILWFTSRKSRSRKYFFAMIGANFADRYVIACYFLIALFMSPATTKSMIVIALPSRRTPAGVPIDARM